MLYVRCVGLAKNAVYPQTPLSSQATRSHPGKVRRYEPKALNEIMRLFFLLIDSIVSFRAFVHSSLISRM